MRVPKGPKGESLALAEKFNGDLGRRVLDARAKGLRPTWARTGDAIQLSRVLNLLQEPNVVFGQAVRSSTLPQ
jgi:hypothetical protein